MKPVSIVTAKAMLTEMKDQIIAMPGLIQFINSRNEDSSGSDVPVVESKTQSDANASKVAEIWTGFTDHLEADPEAEGFEVFVNWKN